MGGGMWGRWRRGRRDAGLAGIGVHASGLSLVRVVRNAQVPARIAIAEFRPYDGAEPDRVLARLVQDHDLKRQPCTTLLGEGEYRLLQTEAPDVKSEELRAALRWRIKDLIDFHVNDATLDVFDVPVRMPGRAALVYVVVGRNEEALIYLIPLILFVILVSLGNDYTVFILSRVVEEGRQAPPRRAIPRGIGFSGAVVTSLGLILAASLGSLGLQPLGFLQQLGIAFAISLVIDTFLVRLFYFPAILSVTARRS